MNAHYVIIPNTAVTVFLKANLTENMRSILEGLVSKIYRKNFKKLCSLHRFYYLCNKNKIMQKMVKNR